MYLIREIQNGEYKLNPRYFGRTRFQFEDVIDEQEGKCFTFRTRDGGSVGLEQYGQDDFDEAALITKIAEKMGSKAQLSTFDEWVVMEITIPENKIKYLEKSS
jgi:hypothetical protein